MKFIEITIGPVALRWLDAGIPARIIKPKSPPPLSISELIDCLRAGWVLRWVPRSLSGIQRLRRGQAIEQRDLWLGWFRHEDHPDLDINGTAYDAFYAGLLVLCEDEETGVGRYWLADAKHPSDAETAQEVLEEMRES